MFDDAPPPLTLPASVEITGRLLRRLQHLDRMEILVTAKAERAQAHLERMNKGKGRRKKRDALWKETRGHCVYCGVQVAENLRTMDHLRPKSKGGTRDMANLVPACYHCNCSRSSKMPASDHVAAEWRDYVLAKETRIGLVPPRGGGSA